MRARKAKIIDSHWADKRLKLNRNTQMTEKLIDTIKFLGGRGGGGGG